METTQPSFPWQQVAQSCPDAYKNFCEYIDNYSDRDGWHIGDSVHLGDMCGLVGYLEAFFDSKQILMIANAYVLPDDWEWSIEVLVEEEEFSGKIYSTRQEAQIAGFEKAFQILQELLTNRPEPA